MLMAKVRLFPLLIALFTLLACHVGSQAATGHSIDITSISSNPSPPRVGEAVDSFTIRFTLKAQSGIDVNRIKIFFDNGDTAFPTSASDFTVTPNVNHPDTRASIIYRAEGITFSQANTDIKISYCLTSFNCNTTLATALINQNAIGSGNNNPGTGGNTNNGNSSNGSVSQIPHVFFLDVEEVTNGDTGTVSLEPKQFRLIIEQDKNYLDSVTEANFNPDTNPILSNLVITSTNTFTGEKTKVTDEYSFDLDSASIVSTTRTGFLVTEYISDSKIIKNGQKLKFNVDLKENYFDKFGIPVVNGAVIQDHDTITIKPLTGSLSNINIAPTSISFSNIGKSKGKSNYVSDSVTISANLNSDDPASTVANVDFFRLNTSNNKIKPKLSINSKKVLNIRPGLNGSGSISNNGDSINLPINLETSAKENFLIKQGFNDPSKTKTLKIPMTITTNTVNGLDLIFTSTLTSTVDTSFQTTTAEVNGNSL